MHEEALMRTHPSPWILGAAIASLTACAPNLSTPNDDVVIGEGEGEGEGEGGEGEGEGEGEAGEGEGEGEGEDGAALYAMPWGPRRGRRRPAAGSLG